MAVHSSILAWKIPWTEESGRLHSPWGHKESHTTERLNNNDQHPFELEKLFSFSSQGIHLNISLNIGMLLCCQTSISLIKTRF